MAVDIAELGLVVRSDGVVVAADRLGELEKKSHKAETATQRLQKQLDKTGKSMRSVGKDFSLYLTTPILAAAVGAVKLAASFDSALAKINTLVGVSREDIAGYRVEILKLAPAVGRGPTELADALFAITSAGIRGAQALEILTQASKASAIGLGDTRSISLAVVAAMTAYGEKTLSASDATAILIGTIEQGNLEASSLAGVIGRVIGVAAQAGVSFRDAGAFIAAFTRQGVSAEQAVTGLRGVLATLVREPTADAIKAFDQMGMSVESFKASIRELGFINAFQNLVNQAEKYGVSLGAVIPEIEALSGAMAVFASEGESAASIATKIGEAVGTIEDRFKAALELDPELAFAQLKATMQATFITIGTKLLPSVIELTNKIKELVTDFSELAPETQSNVLKMIALAAAIGPVLIVVGSFVRILGTLIPVLLRLGALLHPAAAIGVGLGLLVKLIGEIYVQKLLDAVEVTGQFTTSLERLKTVAGLSLNLQSVAGEVDRLIAKQKELTEAIDKRKSGLNTAFYKQRELALLAIEKEALVQNNRELDNAIQLRDDYTMRLAASMQAEQAAADLAAQTQKDLAEQAVADEQAAAAKIAAAAAAREQAEALAELIDVLDPSIQAAEEYTKAWNMLVGALNRGDIDPSEFERLMKLLKQSPLAFDAFGKGIPKIKEFDANIKAALADSMEYVDGLEAMREGVDSLSAQLDPVSAQLLELAKAREFVQDAWDEGVITDPAEFDTLTDGIDKAVEAVTGLGDVFERAATEWYYALNELSGLFEQDSREAEALQTIIQGLNVIMGIHAVIKQLAEGDVYSAIPRALGVAAMIAGMGISTGASGSEAATRTLLESQGTGSVLGDAEAKTESILKATEITADATSELVGINRGMLTALQALQTGLTGAATQLARGGDIDFGALPSVFQPGDVLKNIPLVGEIFGNILNKIFGGSAKVIDQGVQILGGTLDEIVFQAFQTVSSKKHIFASTKIRDRFADLDDEVADQFALILGSIADTVRQAAIAIGIPLDEIEVRLASFEIAAQKISLKDLTGEEQREELLAAFGEIFDDLAGHVIPFIDQFQKVGEGLGETLVRVATSVQVFQEAIGALGLTVNQTDPELFAQMAVGLVELTGGVENFIAQFTTFFDKFASDEQKLAFATDQLTRAFDQAGLVIPETRDGMWDLMQTLDASTESGREQIATLLRLADVADQYYSLLEKLEESRLDELRQKIRDFADSDFIADYERLVMLGDETPVSRLTRMASELFDLVAGFDGTQEGLAAIADGFGDIRQAGIDAVASIDAAWKGLTATISRLRQDTLDIISGPKSDRQIFVEAAGLVDLARKAQTPEELARLGERFDQLIRQLPPETAQRLGGDLISLIDKFQAAADTSFERIRDTTLDAIQSINAMADAFLTRIPDTLLAVAASNERVAVAIETLASQQSVASNTTSTNESEESLLTLAADALSSGVEDMKRNIAAAIQSGFGNARVTVNVHMSKNGLNTQ